MDFKTTLSSGAFIINKEKGMTSRRVDNIFMKEYRFKKVGHLGTLDPFATGVLVVFVNRGTKLIPFFEEFDKEYIATIKLGEQTDTGDEDGTIINTLPIPSLDFETVSAYLKTLIGANQQIPPMYSALKKDGVPLYKLAREGKVISREPRLFYIQEIELLELDQVHLKYRVVVSKGTYIRTLSEDICAHFATTGHLVGLVRSRVGPFLLENAKQVNAVQDEDLLTTNSLFQTQSIYEINDDEYEIVKRANDLSLQFDSPYVLIKYRDEPLAVYAKADGVYVFKRGLQ